MSSDVELILDALKKRVRSQDMTYADLAQKTGTTEAAIKNISYSRSISLDKLVGLCDAVGLSLGELLQVAGLGVGGDLVLSEENEQFFVEHPGHLAFFRELVLLRKSVKQIQKDHKLDEASLFLYLRRLEKMGLIEITGQSQVHLKVRGRLRWRVGGPWFKKHYLNVLAGQARKFLERPEDPDHFLSFGAFSLKRKDLERFYEEIEQLVTRYKDLAVLRSLSQSDAERRKEVFVGFNFLIAAGPHPEDNERIPPIRK